MPIKKKSSYAILSAQVVGDSVECLVNAFIVTKNNATHVLVRIANAY